jgi:hypothetical protein
MKTKFFYFKTLTWITVTIMTTMFFSCEKDDEPFKECRKHPDCEYFTCKVNGKRWEPQCDGGPLFGCTPWDVQYYKKSGFLEAIIQNEETKTGIKIELREIKLENTKYGFERDSGYFNSNNIQDCVFFNLSTGEFNEISFETIDTINYFIKAKFSMVTINECGEEVHITEGEFNLPYRF